MAQLVEHRVRDAGSRLRKTVRKICRGVAQLVEHHVRDVGAAGSNPVTPIKNGMPIGHPILNLITDLLSGQSRKYHRVRAFHFDIVNLLLNMLFLRAYSRISEDSAHISFRPSHGIRRSDTHPVRPGRS